MNALNDSMMLYVHSSRPCFFLFFFFLFFRDGGTGVGNESPGPPPFSQLLCSALNAGKAGRLAGKGGG